MAENGSLSSYVVQRFYDDELVWKDVGSVDVPQRTKRRTILLKALGDAPAAGTYRVLDGESAVEMAVSLEDQPPKVVIA